MILDASIDRDGAFHFDALPSGDYELSTVGSGDDPAPMQVTIVAGQRVHVELRAPTRPR